MQSLDEWRFEFAVSGMAPVHRAVIDALLDEAIAWAEARTLSIGGGYRPVTPEVAGAATAWRFKFGLCVQADDLLIPELQAAGLRDVLRTWCGARGMSFAGGCRAFTPEECGVDAEPGAAADGGGE